MKTIELLWIDGRKITAPVFKDIVVDNQDVSYILPYGETDEMTIFVMKNDDIVVIDVDYETAKESFTDNINNE